MEAEIGKILKGKYQITEKVGVGSLKETIYHGMHLELDTEIVIRVLPAGTNANDEVSKRFFQGIKLAAGLQHPNIVSVLDAGEEDGIVYFVTSYHKGFYLNDFLDQRGQLDENESIRLIKSLADALEYAWDELQIVHRNICPNTILIAKGNVPMLTDFGLAKSLERDSKLTLQGYTVGEPSYMSPEQAKGDEVDYRSDIYCLGLVFYQLLAGNPPFQSKNLMELMQMQISEPHKPIQAVNELVSDSCAAVIDKMLEKDINLRYQSLKALVKDLDAILNAKIPSAMKVDEKKIKAIKRASEKKAAQKYRKEMEKVKDALKNETRNRLKRNVIIITVIVNLLILGWFIMYMMKKKKNAAAQQPLPESVPVNMIISSGNMN
jgi:serine/threonine-protein kinase